MTSPRHSLAHPGLPDARGGTGAPRRVRGAPEADRDLLARLFVEEQPRLCRSVRRRLGDAEEAADIVQDAFARLAGTGSADVLRAPKAYLQRIVGNLLRDRAKSRRARILDHAVEMTEARHPVMAADQGCAIEAADVLALYQVALASLTPRTREVFLLHRVDELRYRDIAERLGISVATVEYHMARALVRLDEVLYR